jgi:hypothetical protein
MIPPSANSRYKLDGGVCLVFVQRPAALMLLLGILTLLVSTPAMALPTVFTDRDAFNQAVGEHTVFTFAPEELVLQTYDPIATTFRWYFGDQLLVASDNCCNPTLGESLNFQHYISQGIGTTMPVWAFGADFTPLSESVTISRYADGSAYTLTTPTFLGWLYEAPVPVSFRWLPDLTDHYDRLGMGLGYIRVDNVAVKRVPEPSTLLFLSLGFLGLLGWQQTREWRL